jgi:dihydrofolate reductase
MTRQLAILVAMDAQRGIGVNNTLPWRLPEDLAHFKRTTTGHPVLMGRKTFESIGRPLPNRRNIVISRNSDFAPPGVEVARSLADAIALTGQELAFIIGGAQIYAQAIDLADTLIITEIAHTFECDAFFPAFDTQKWQETARQAYHSDANGFDYAFVTLNRK